MKMIDEKTAEKMSIEEFPFPKVCCEEKKKKIIHLRDLYKKKLMKASREKREYDRR